MKYTLFMFILVNIFLFLMLPDKLIHRMYYYTMTRPDVYTYLTPYGYVFSFILDIIVNIGACFYVLIITLTIGSSFFIYKTPILDQIRFLIKHPFSIPKIQGRCYHVSNALANNGYIFHDINSKLYWDALFKTCNVRTPNVYGVIEEGNINMFMDLPSDERLVIIKPVKLYSANGIKLFNQEEIPEKGHYIIQEYIKSFNKLPHSIRIVTIRNKKEYIDTVQHWMTTLSVNSNEDALTTSVGGKTVNDYEIKEDLARNVLDDEWIPHHLSMNNLNSAVEEAKKLHLNMKYFIQSVGWDLILTDDGHYFLEGNMCHGIARKRDIYYYDRIQDFIDKAYKDN
jgi:hypothetical protein